jgi:hypothetical protein
MDATRVLKAPVVVDKSDVKVLPQKLRGRPIDVISDTVAGLKHQTASRGDIPPAADGGRGRCPDSGARIIARMAATVNGRPSLDAKARTSTIPLVFFTLGDPVMSEFVHTFNRPAGHLQDPRPLPTGSNDRESKCQRQGS